VDALPHGGYVGCLAHPDNDDGQRKRFALVEQAVKGWPVGGVTVRRNDQEAMLPLYLCHVVTASFFRSLSLSLNSSLDKLSEWAKFRLPAQANCPHAGLVYLHEVARYRRRCGAGGRRGGRSDELLRWTEAKAVRD